ncbi:MAG: hypothetical protein HKN85_07540 [Gammaproteobacteria bacterium]|nr:hypothetical protein [Gammaproteobacteria bacterium]
MFLMITAYFLIGLLFGIYFAIAGCARIDPAAASAGPIVRMMWLPAATLLWPFLINKLINADQQEGGATK